MLDAMQGRRRLGARSATPRPTSTARATCCQTRRDGVPAVAFKAAMVNAASYFPSLTKVLLKQALYI
jgi:hypothetical protein